MSTSDKQLQVSCSCGATTHSFFVSLSALPLSTHLCSCNISRRISGSLLTSYINITHDPNALKPNTSTCTAYHSSDILRRWFCTTCGTHMYLEYYSDGHFEAATGTLATESSDGLVKFESCMWIGDTGDGGASQFITSISGTQLKRWKQDAGKSEAVDLGLRSVAAPSPANFTKRPKTIHAHCHCHGVEFWVTWPVPLSKFAKSPFPDLQSPYHLNQSANPENVCWWLPKENRYLAGTCACQSCRRASGFDITFWAFIPTSNIFLDESCTIPFQTASGSWGSMKTYASSPGVTRSFCSGCGANIFWHGDKDSFGREALIDVAVGLLDSPTGARAEDLLSWWPDRVSFAEFALNRGLVQGLESGLQNWAEANDGEPCVAKG